MRVLHINCNYIETPLHQIMIQHLDELGGDNYIFAPTYDKNLSIISEREKVCISECFNKWDRLLFDYKQKKIKKSVQESMDVASFDCIHAYTLFTDGNCAMELSKKYNIPYIVAIRNTDINDFMKKMIYLRGRGVMIMRRAKAIFFLSETYRKQMFEKYIPLQYRDELMKKSHIIPNGIDNFWFENKPSTERHFCNENTINLIYAGRVEKNKNISTTQKAMRLLREKGYKVSLTVVGKIEERKEFDKISRDTWTTYISPVSKERLIDYYGSHDIFVMPSFKETFGLVYAEAMSQGLPIIYTRGQGFDGQFDEGVVGYSVNPKCPEEIADKIVSILNNYQEMSERCLVHVRKFDWKKIVNFYAEIYSS